MKTTTMRMMKMKMKLLSLLCVSAAGAATVFAAFPGADRTRESAREASFLSLERSPFGRRLARAGQSGADRWWHASLGAGHACGQCTSAAPDCAAGRPGDPVLWLRGLETARHAGGTAPAGAHRRFLERGVRARLRRCHALDPVNLTVFRALMLFTTEILPDRLLAAKLARGAVTAAERYRGDPEAPVTAASAARYLAELEPERAEVRRAEALRHLREFRLRLRALWRPWTGPPPPRLRDLLEQAEHLERLLIPETVPSPAAPLPPPPVPVRPERFH